MMAASNTNAGYDLGQEVEKLKVLYDEEYEKRSQEDDHDPLISRLRVEQKLRQDYRTQVSDLANHRHNRFYDISLPYCRNSVPLIRLSAAANIRYNSGLQQQRGREIPKSLEDARESLRGRFLDQFISAEGQEEASLPEPAGVDFDEKTQSITDNTELVKSLLKSIMEPRSEQNSSNNRNLIPASQRFETAVTDPTANQETFFAKMKDFSTVVKDLLNVMQPFLSDPNGRQENKSDTHKQELINDSKISPDVNAASQQYGTLTVQNRESMHSSNKKLDRSKDNRTPNGGPGKAPRNQPSKEPKVRKPHHTDNKKTKPKSLKRMQQVARDYNL